MPTPRKNKSRRPKQGGSLNNMPWFTRKNSRQRKRNKMAKASRRRNRDA